MPWLRGQGTWDDSIDFFRVFCEDPTCWKRWQAWRKNEHGRQFPGGSDTGWERHGMAGHNELGKSRIVFCCWPSSEKDLGRGPVKITKPYQPPKWMGQPLADLHGRSANDQPFVGIATKNAPGIGWSYYRYPHIASSAWLGLALLQKPSEDSPVWSLGIW